jgi:DNA repair exonuclease SbcCD ATPase subunit
MRIAHTADIHIRALSRHDEYRRTFQDFVDDCRSQRVDHIFVGGDIFHTKTTGISPEYIDLLTWWLRSMSQVAPVHLILGNHDGNLVNSSRQDAVSPIVEALADPRVHLYKTSGVYPIEDGYNLCVYSLFDEEGWSRVAPVEGEVNIACYHGPVWGSHTESDWEVEDGVKVDFFSQYPFTFLGDIHKRQDLSFRDGKPVMSYPGTLIQQNYAEEIDHGYLLWDIASVSDWNVVFRKLNNAKPYVTIPWQGDVDATLATTKAYPDGTRFRIKSDLQIPQDSIHLLSSTLKTSRLATEVTYKFDHQIDRTTVSAGSSVIVKNDLRSPDVLSKLLKDFHGDKVTQDDVEVSSSLIKSYLSTVSLGEDVTRGSKWSLRSIAWDNMFVYGEGNLIDFDKLNGIVGIFGSNRTGKSSIVGTIMYSLFNTTDRGPMKNIYMCNVRKDYCSSKAIFAHDGTNYIVERQTTKSANKKGVVSASTALNLYRVRDDGSLDDLCGEQRNDTEKTIRSLIGNSDDFLMTSLSAQGEINQFISQGSTKRRSILTRFLDLDVFDKLYDLANKDLSGIKAQLKNYPERDWDSLTQANTSRLEELESEVSTLTITIAETQSNLDETKGQLSTKSGVVVTKNDVEVQKNKVFSLQNKADECRNSISQLKSDILGLEEKIDSVDSLISRYDIEDIKSRIEGQRRLETSILELEHVFDKENAALDRQKKSLKLLDEVPCGDEHPTCKFIKSAHLDKEKMKEQTSAVETAKASLAAAKSSLDKIRDESLEDKLSKHAKALELRAKMKLEVSRKETEIEKLRASCDSCETSLSEAKERLKTLADALENSQNAETAEIRAKIDSLTRSLKQLDVARLDAVDARGKLKAQIEKLAEEKTFRDDLLAKMRLQELITTAFSKKGMPLLITKTQLPLINAEVAKILHGIVDFDIELENDEDSDSLEIYINYGDSRRIVELCSGMEKTIASIALRVAMINVTTLPKPDIFIIDEGFGTLDNLAVEACNRLLASLKKYFRTVVVITHVDGIKDAADHVIEISKSEKDSHVEYP